MAALRIPLVVIGGLLGAGKTTLVNRLPGDAAGRRIAGLVNDFGAVNVDAALIAAAFGDRVALANGCVCCAPRCAAQLSPHSSSLPRPRSRRTRPAR